MLNKMSGTICNAITYLIRLLAPPWVEGGKAPLWYGLQLSPFEGAWFLEYIIRKQIYNPLGKPGCWLARHPEAATRYPAKYFTEIYQENTETFKFFAELPISSWNVLCLILSKVAYFRTGIAYLQNVSTGL
jgi:hypothetical protein